jgi:hypothetical protein
MISYRILLTGVTMVTLLASGAVLVPVLPAASAADPGIGGPLSLSSYERRLPEPEQLVLGRLAIIKDTDRNRPEAAALLTTLAVLCAQQGKNTEADFYYQAAIECLKGAPR